jgi:DNA polymerase-3 subunit epsilon
MRVCRSSKLLDDHFGRDDEDQYSIEQYGQAAVIDVETTGLDATRHEVLELAIMLFLFKRTSGQIIGIKDQYVGLQEPSQRIPLEATAIHGIHEKMVRNRRLDDHRIMSLMSQAEFIIAHNARFDYSFVTRLYPSTAQKTWLCSMLQIDWRSYGFYSRGLQNLLENHKLSVETMHRAQYDCQGILLLLNSKNSQGEHYLKELLLSLPCSNSK